MLIDDGLTPEQRFHDHVKAYGALDKTLTERIEANLALARKAGSPHMRRYYVQVARLQNRMIVNDRRALRGMAQGRELPFREARDEEDEEHVHPLQLDVIDRALVLWSNPSETVLTPFAGVGSEAYGAVKASYYRQMLRNLEAATVDLRQDDLFSLAGIEVAI